MAPLALAGVGITTRLLDWRGIHLDDCEGVDITWWLLCLCLICTRPPATKTSPALRQLEGRLRRQQHPPFLVLRRQLFHLRFLLTHYPDNPTFAYGKVQQTIAKTLTLWHSLGLSRSDPHRFAYHLMWLMYELDQEKPVVSPRAWSYYHLAYDSWRQVYGELREELRQE